MNEQCIVIGNGVLMPKYIAEDDIPRDGGRWPEYANTMLICIDSFEKGLANGRLHNFYFEKTDVFSSLDQLLFSMEDIMEKAQMPQATYEVRTPTPMKRPSGKRKKYAAEVEMAKLDEQRFGKFSPFYTLQTLNAVGGRLANFYIRVFARQHASMQGLLVDSESNEIYAFKSELELIRYLRDLLNGKLQELGE